ncbi:MAG TPA: 23S rRNA (adenine(2503)-C(2))-methyltransferase RlmN, partial [Cyclobacteriaceae bacterium]
MITTAGKQDIRKLSLDEMKAFFLAHGEKEYRARQLYEWI